MFAAFYGRACRNYVLTVLATGGLYVVGGVAAKNHQIVKEPALLVEFFESPTHGALLRDVLVRLNVNEDSGRWGAALYGVNALRREARVRALGAAPPTEVAHGSDQAGFAKPYPGVPVRS